MMMDIFTISTDVFECVRWSREFKINMTLSDVEEFENIINNDNDIDKYMKKYQIQEHNVLCDEDVYSLLLSAAIVNGRKQVVKYILNKNRGNILVHINACYLSPIVNAMIYYDKEIIENIKEYIKKYITLNLRVKCRGHQYGNIVNIIKHSEDISIHECIDLVRPLHINTKFLDFWINQYNHDLFNYCAQY